MGRADLIAYCLGKPGAYLDTPWGDGAVVKVEGKIFCFLGAPDGPDDDDVRALVDDSYRLVVAGLSKSRRPT